MSRRTSPDRRYQLLWFVVLGLLVSGAPAPVAAAGLFEDLPARTAFLLCPQQATLRGDATGSRGGDTDGEVYALTATFSLRPYFLFGISQPYISVSGPDGQDTGAGDTWLLTRLRLYNRHERSFSFLANAGIGNGSTELFPYSAQSLDFDLSFAYVDSLPAFHFWVEGGAVFVSREPKDLPDDIRHTDCFRAGGGIVIPLGVAPELRLGGMFLRYESDARREIASAELLWSPSRTLQFRLSGQAETGPESQRVADYAVGAGLTVRY